MTETPKPRRQSFSKPGKRSGGPSGKPSERGSRVARPSLPRGERDSKRRGQASDFKGRSESGTAKPGARFTRDAERPRRAPRIEPEIPADIEAKMLPGKTRAELLSLSAENAEVVAKQMVMIERLLATDQDADLLLANEFARAASNRAGRVGVVRNQAGKVALARKDFAEAKRHLSAALRISGSAFAKILLAECETGLGRPRKALDLLGEIDSTQLSTKENAYAHLISAEAREALGQIDAARVTLTPRLGAFLESAAVGPEVDTELPKLLKRWNLLTSRLSP